MSSWCQFTRIYFWVIECNQPVLTILKTKHHVKKEDFKVEVENGVLTISAEKKEEKKESKKNYTRQEYYYNSFTRSFTLPENAKEDDLVARYEDGMLKLAVAKKAITVSKAREIEVA